MTRCFCFVPPAVPWVATRRSFLPCSSRQARRPEQRRERKNPRDAEARKMCLSATRFGLPNPSPHYPLLLRRRFEFHREFHPERVQNHVETAEDRVAMLG